LVTVWVKNGKNDRLIPLWVKFLSVVSSQQSVVISQWSDPKQMTNVRTRLITSLTNVQTRLIASLNNYTRNKIKM